MCVCAGETGRQCFTIRGHKKLTRRNALAESDFHMWGCHGKQTQQQPTGIYYHLIIYRWCIFYTACLTFRCGGTFPLQRLQRDSRLSRFKKQNLLSRYFFVCKIGQGRVLRTLAEHWHYFPAPFLVFVIACMLKKEKSDTEYNLKMCAAEGADSGGLGSAGNIL